MLSFPDDVKISWFEELRNPKTNKDSFLKFFNNFLNIHDFTHFEEMELKLEFTKICNCVKLWLFGKTKVKDISMNKYTPIMEAARILKSKILEMSNHNHIHRSNSENQIIEDSTYTFNEQVMINVLRSKIQQENLTRCYKCKKKTDINKIFVLLDKKYQMSVECYYCVNDADIKSSLGFS